MKLLLMFDTMFILFSISFINIPFLASQNVTECQENEYQCFNGECIHLTKFCDAISYDCSDNSDEKSIRIDCEIECLLRHDLYGTKYIGNKKINKEGQACDSLCRGSTGLGPTCLINGQPTLCQIQFCNLRQGRTVNCAAGELCTLQDRKITSNSTISLLSESSTLHIEGTSNGHVTISSPVVAIPSEDIYAYCISYYYEIQTSGNVQYGIMPYFGLSVAEENIRWRNDKFFKYYVEIEKPVYDLFQYQAKFSIYWRSSSSFFMIFKMTNVDIEDTECYGTLKIKVKCTPERYTCGDRDCISTDAINDQYDDCLMDEHYSDIPSYSEKRDEDCDMNDVYCSESKSCIPGNSSLHMMIQCYTSDKRPTEPSSVQCPGFKHCKNEPGTTPVCVSERQICDEIPHCPHWDDENDCPLFCPPNCSRCDGKRFKCSSSALPNIPIRVSYLDLSGHPLDAKTLCLKRRSKLVFLNISLSDVNDVNCIYDRHLFPSLRQIDLSFNDIEVVYKEKSNSIYSINMSSNPLRLVYYKNLYRDVIFKGCNISEIYWVQNQKTKEIHIAFNEIPSGFVQSFDMICTFTSIDLSWNSVTDLESLRLCYELNHINLKHNRIKNIRSLDFFGKYNNALLSLNLADNFITNLNSFIFSKLQKLVKLEIMTNFISIVHEDAFHGLARLRYLDISRNYISFIKINTFTDLYSLEELYLHENKIESLLTYTFSSMLNLQVLDLHSNYLTVLPEGMFDELSKLTYLDVSQNAIKIGSLLFRGLGKLVYLKVHSFTLCCVRPQSVKAHQCSAPKHTLSSCSNLLKTGFLSVIIWFIGLATLTGNACYIYTTFQVDNNTSSNILMLSLSFSDIMLGVYLIIISYSDVNYKGRYGLIHDNWLLSDTCKAAGIIFISSSVSSNIMHFFIVVYRWVVLRKPFLEYDRIIRCAATAIVWIMTCAVLVLTMLNSHTDLSREKILCIPLLHKDLVIEQNTKVLIVYISIKIFFNSGILLGEIIIRQDIRLQRAYMDLPPSTHISMTSLCAMSSVLRVISSSPITIFGCFALLGGMSFHGEVYLWAVVIIIPLCSIFNPLILYLIKTKQSTMVKMLHDHDCFRISMVYPAMILRTNIYANHEDSTVNTSAQAGAGLSQIHTDLRAGKTAHPEDRCADFPQTTLLLMTQPRIQRCQAIQIWIKDSNGWITKGQSIKIHHKAIRCEIPQYAGHDSHLKIQVVLMEAMVKSPVQTIPVS